MKIIFLNNSISAYSWVPYDPSGELPLHKISVSFDSNFNEYYVGRVNQHYADVYLDPATGRYYALNQFGRSDSGFDVCFNMNFIC